MTAGPIYGLMAEFETPTELVEAAKGAFLMQAADDVDGPIPSTYSMFLETMYQGSPFSRPPHALTVRRTSDRAARR